MPAWQPEAIQAEKQALEAKSSKDSSVSDKLDILITSVSYLKEDYKKFKNRLALLEARVEKSLDDAKRQADEYSHEDFENEIEDSEEDANQLDSESSFNDSFDAGVIADYVGPAIDKGIASRINEGLLLPSDRSRTRDQITSNRCAPKQAFASALYISDYLSTIDICDSSSDTWPSVKFVIASQMDIVIILTICGSGLEYNKMMPSCNLSFATGALDSAAKKPNFRQRRTMGL